MVAAFRRFLSFATLPALALLLLLTRPRWSTSSSSGDAKTASCLSNLDQIARAYALYARDFDGKLPLGIDPEDRAHPEIWASIPGYGGSLYPIAQRAPYLHQVLRPYVASATVFHCPADLGWSRSRLTLGDDSPLLNVRPSSFAAFGTSYYCLTKTALLGNTASNIQYPGQMLLVFDGDGWHQGGTVNGLFADGHTQNLSVRQFSFFARDQIDNFAFSPNFAR